MSFTKLYLDPENKTFADIMSNGKSYRVPNFQRDYSWENEHLDELWQDIEHMRRSESQHFMGYLVLQSQDNKQFEIIDGQQRITTITLMIIAALSRFNDLIEQNNEDVESRQRKEFYHKTYLGVFNAVTLGTSLTLELNRGNKKHFKDIIEFPYGVPKKRGLTETNRLLNRTLEFFQEKLKNYPSQELAKLIDAVGDGLLFTTITVNDDLNAYLVFETLNARGVHLSASDLLKNYLLSTLLGDREDSTADSDTFEEKWNQSVEQLGETNFTAFLRSYEGMHSKLKPKKELYRFLKGERIKTREQVMPYVQDLYKFAPIYAALQNPDDAFWKDYGGGQYLECLDDLRTLKLFQIKTPLSILMASYDKLAPGDFIQTVKWVTVLSIRYNVICGKLANEQEPVYNQLAMKMIKENGPKQDVKTGLKQIYPGDEEFVSAFSQKSMPSKRSSRKITYLLQEIEKHLSGGSEISTGLTLEHILPFHPDTAWQDYFGVSTYNDAVDRLGNMALLPQVQNLGQESFDEKKDALNTTGYKINKKIASYDKWNIDSINGYQKWLANQAKTVWRIDF